MTPSGYLENNKDSLLSIFGQFRLGYELDLKVNSNLEEETVDRLCCLGTILSHRHNDGEVDFPIELPKKVLKTDQKLAEELYSIILCEEAVRSGLLSRSGVKYCPVDMSKITEPEKFGKYLLK